SIPRRGDRSTGQKRRGVPLCFPVSSVVVGFEFGLRPNAPYRPLRRFSLVEGFRDFAFADVLVNRFAVFDFFAFTRFGALAETIAYDWRMRSSSSVSETASRRSSRTHL